MRTRSAREYTKLTVQSFCATDDSNRPATMATMTECHEENLEYLLQGEELYGPHTRTVSPSDRPEQLKTERQN
jgi:hypothetical protein